METYIFNNKKVQIQDSRRTGEDMNYVYLDESGNRASISCALSEFNEYFVLTNEPFSVKTKKDDKNILYDVVYKIGKNVLEVIKPSLTKDRAFKFKQWAVKQATPSGMMSNYRANSIKVQKAR